MSTLSVDTIQGQTTAANLKLPAGYVIQTVQHSASSTNTTTSSSFVDTTCTGAITPKYSTSKILIIVSGGMEGTAGGGTTESSEWKLFRGSTQVESSTHGKRIYLTANHYVPLHSVFLDSPSTTSSTTYTLKMKRAGGSGTVSWNRDGTQTWTLTLQEIAQ